MSSAEGRLFVGGALTAAAAGAAGMTTAGATIAGMERTRPSWRRREVMGVSIRGQEGHNLTIHALLSHPSQGMSRNYKSVLWTHPVSRGGAHHMGRHHKRA